MRGVRSSRSCVSDPLTPPGGGGSTTGHTGWEGWGERGGLPVLALGGLKSLELHGVGSAAPTSPARHLSRPELGRLGRRVCTRLGSSTKVVLALVRRIGVRDFVRHVWGVPDAHPDVLVLKM